MITKKAFFSFTFISNSLFAYQIEEKKIHLHFDINKTIIAMDAVQGKGIEETVNGVLAEFTFEKWDGQIEQSFYAYTTAQIEQEYPLLSRTSGIFKKLRAERLANFPEHLKQYPELLVQYEKDKASMLQILSTEKIVIFPSFFKTIEWLNQNFPNRYAIYLRTFGKDLSEIIQTLADKKILTFKSQGKFKERTLDIADPNKPLSEFFKNPDLNHYALCDDYTYWESKDFQAIGGKPFFIDINDSQNVSIFFDDNANDLDKPIICPLGFSSDLEDTQELMKKGNIVAVNPKEAILNENYFIDKIKFVLT